MSSSGSNSRIGRGIRHGPAPPESWRTVSAIASRSLETPEQLAAWWREADDQAEVEGSRSPPTTRSTLACRPPRAVADRPAQRGPEFTVTSCLAAGTPIITELGPRPSRRSNRGIVCWHAGRPDGRAGVQAGPGANDPGEGRASTPPDNVGMRWSARRASVLDQRIGWVQARAWPGMPLHAGERSDRGPRSVEPAGRTGLQPDRRRRVAYFVGRESPILSHDVTPRAPTKFRLSPVWLRSGRRGMTRGRTFRAFGERTRPLEWSGRKTRKTTYARSRGQCGQPRCRRKYVPAEPISQDNAARLTSPLEKKGVLTSGRGCAFWGWLSRPLAPDRTSTRT